MYKTQFVLIHTLVTLHFINYISTCFSLIQDYSHQHSIHIVTMSSSIISMQIISICFYQHCVHSHISNHVFVKIIITFVALSSFCPSIQVRIFLHSHVFTLSCHQHFPHANCQTITNQCICCGYLQMSAHLSNINSVY